MGHTVVVVEDEEQVRELVRRYLEREGFEVLATGSGARGLVLLEDEAPDLAVVDLGLPDVPGEEVVRAAVAARIPAVVLSARSTVDERIRGLELGADDYVAKPFSPRELMLRVRAVLHRAGGGSDEAAASYGAGTLRLDPVRRELHVRGQLVSLTPTEWGILAALASDPGRVFTRFQLIHRVRGEEFAGYARVIDSHVKNLRHKLGEDPDHPRIVETVVGAGYRMGLRRDP